MAMTPFGPVVGYQPSDSEDSTTADVLAKLARNQQYDASPFGMVAAWLERQTDALKGASALNPATMALEGAKTANRWLGSAGYPEQVQQGDMLAPFGMGAMLSPGRVLPRDEAMAKVLHREAPREASALPDLGFYENFLRPAGEVGNSAAKLEAPPFKDIANDRRLGVLAADQARASVPGMVVNGAASAAESPGVRAYHGSPHDFDRFSLDKIGTGEGAQAYGHGLYFAEKEGVAKQYRDQLTNQANFKTADGGLWDADGLEHMNVRSSARRGDLDAAIAKAEEIAASGSPVSAMAARDLEKLKALKQAGGISPNPGRMYEVNINADPEHFLDWDKPLAEQSEKVRAAVAGTGKAPDPAALRARAEASRARGLDSEADFFEGQANHFESLLGRSGAEGYNAAYQKAGGADAARQALREAGIPGIRYLDQGSRGAGEGSSNYVVFDDKLIEILRKYGIALPFGLGAAGAGALGQNEPEVY
jgi:hypothetical protein